MLSDTEIIESYIATLQAELRGEDPSAAAMDETEATSSDEQPFPPLYESGEDYDQAGDLKQEAADLKSSGDWEGALEKYTAAVLAAPPSALLYANRATALLALGRPHAAERDCEMALQENPDSAKALRVRGKARKELGQYEKALKDLSAAQAIDFDEGTVEDLKFLTEKHLETEKSQADKRNQEEDKMRKRAEEIKKAREDAKKDKEAAEASRDMPGMPGGGMPGGMPAGMDMSALTGLMSDPEIVAAMSNPKVQGAFQELMAGPGGPMGLMNNPQKLQELMGDPEVGPVMQKIMSKLTGGMGGAGMGGGGFGGTAGPGNDGDDEMPDLDDLPDLE